MKLSRRRFGYGYVQAQDHLERMMLLYRDAQGRRAEVQGKSALGIGLRFDEDDYCCHSPSIASATHHSRAFSKEMRGLGRGQRTVYSLIRACNGCERCIGDAFDRLRSECDWTPGPCDAIQRSIWSFRWQQRP